MPPIPAYLVLPTLVHDALTKVLMAWAFGYSGTGERVYVYHRDNLAVARKAIRDANLADQVTVRLMS